MTAGPAQSWSEDDERAVRAQLDRIIKSSAFNQSKRRQRFLEYVVTEALAGRAERLKGYAIGLEVFDRPERFDPVADPIVRIEAARVREKLREFYASEGERDAVRIDLPKGGYAPLIEFKQAAAPEPQPERPGPTTADRDADPPPSIAGARSIRHTQLRIAALGLALILVLGAAGAWLSRHYIAATVEPVSGTAAPDEPIGPAIAVLPFVNLSGDPKEEYFSDGLTEDILTELARTRDLRVLARNTTFQYKGKPVDVSKLGRDLKARYVLEGSIQRTGDRLRVTAQLIDAETGAHIWADRFDRQLADVFVVQDEIVSEIVSKIAGGFGVIERAEVKSAVRKSPNQIQAYDLVLHAHDVMQYDWNRANFSSARELLRQAIALDPANARARRETAWLDVIGWVFRFDETPAPANEITAQAAKAVQLDPADSRARMVAALAYFFNKQLDLFEHEAKQAIALAPYDAEIQATVGYMFGISGQWARGVALVKRAYALNAYAATGWYHATMYLNYYLSGDYERALEVIRQDPGQKSTYVYIGYIPIYGQLGRTQDALDNWRKLLSEDRSWSAKSFETWYRMRNMRDEDIAKLMGGVYKSGVLASADKPGQ